VGDVNQGSTLDQRARKIARRANNAMAAQILAHFASKHILLSERFIATLLTSIHPPPSTITPALLSTINTSFLNNPLHTSAAPESFLPANLPQKHNITITGPALVQTIHVEDIGLSRLAQLEALEKAVTERGPQGLRVVDLPADEEGEEGPVASSAAEGIAIGKSMCKVVLEDGNGQRVYAMEVKPIEGIKVGMSLGAKVPRLPRLFDDLPPPPTPNFTI